MRFNFVRDRVYAPKAHVLTATLPDAEVLFREKHLPLQAKN